MKEAKAYCGIALEKGINEAKIIDPRSVITAEWVRIKCQYGCPGYGLRLWCPPHTPTPDLTRRIIDSYEKAILLHLRMRKGERERARSFNKAIVSLEIEIFLDGYTIRLGAWAIALVASARIVTPLVFVGMDLKQGLQWKLAELMSSRRQGVMVFLSKW